MEPQTQSHRDAEKKNWLDLTAEMRFDVVPSVSNRGRKHYAQWCPDCPK